MLLEWSWKSDAASDALLLKSYPLCPEEELTLPRKHCASCCRGRGWIRPLLPAGHHESGRAQGRGKRLLGRAGAVRLCGESRGAETVRDKPLQPEYVRAALTVLQTWPRGWRERGNSAGEGRPRGLRGSSDGSSEGWDGAQGRDRGGQLCQPGRVWAGRVCATGPG